jgi:hypothetical protein
MSARLKASPVPDAIIGITAGLDDLPGKPGREGAKVVDQQNRFQGVHSVE